MAARSAIQPINSRGLSAAETQRCFRAALEAMAHPGRIVPLGFSPADPPGLARVSWAPATWALCSTLLDRETPVWLDAAARRAGVTEELRFHRNTPLVDDVGVSQFALVLDPATMPALNAFALGTHEAPERSATLVIELRELGGDAGWQLGGPGIAGGARLAALPLPPDFAAQWQRNHGLFPRGVDILFTCGADIAALPRTTRIEA